MLQEGEVGAGDDIVKIGDGPERMTVADIDALLYLPGPFQGATGTSAPDSCTQQRLAGFVPDNAPTRTSTQTVQGNPGLANEDQTPVWPGFKQLRVAGIRNESKSVTSFILLSIEGQDLPILQPGQFIVLRLRVDPGKPPILRSYSLSDLPANDHFRISVKSESMGLGVRICARVYE